MLRRKRANLQESRRLKCVAQISGGQNKLARVGHKLALIRRNEAATHGHDGPAGQSGHSGWSLWVFSISIFVYFVALRKVHWTKRCLHFDYGPFSTLALQNATSNAEDWDWKHCSGCPVCGEGSFAQRKLII